MKKYINIVPVLGLIVLLMAMPLFYGAIFLGSFILDVTPTVHPQPGHEDHGPNIWNGMPKAEYEKIKYLEEHKY
ncbi:hypothetical protein [Peribacillus sp. ACCC06369]|uniref:hypothetical protein n=1 Tax=Peribacillus sp. ACCC06369 TaxID=3055860 RepID=UPI0025A111B3|nr:hypothetical protein [Peribacillus sp. ACCC06369]MDM5359699.1 hypothetical protein [Peribacillus sp. ACCC06369]